MSIISKKICMVGDFGVGKTSLIRRFIDQQFSDHYLSTIGVKISRKLLPLPSLDGSARSIQLMIWDVEGKTQFQPIAPSYLEGAAAAIIVADVNRQETIAHINEHVALINAVNKNSASLMIALNKIDTLTDTTDIADDELFHGLKAVPNLVSTCFTSAKTGELVGEMFAAIAERLMQDHQGLNPTMQGIESTR
jgi:small GTP-binding protein